MTPALVDTAPTSPSSSSKVRRSTRAIVGTGKIARVAARSTIITVHRGENTNRSLAGRLPTGRRPYPTPLHAGAQPNPGDIRRLKTRRGDRGIRAGQRTIGHAGSQYVCTSCRTFRPIIPDVRRGGGLQRNLQGRGAFENHRQPVPAKQRLVDRRFCQVVDHPSQPVP